MGQPADVQVAAAVSLTEALQEIAAAAEKQQRIRVTLNLAASNVLARQIVSGSGADVFISADAAQMDVVAKEGLIRQRVDLLVNQLVVAVRSDSRLLWRRRPISRSPGCAGLPSGIRRAFRPVSTRNSSWKRLACGDAWSPRSFPRRACRRSRLSSQETSTPRWCIARISASAAACGRLSRRCPSRASCIPRRFCRRRRRMPPASSSTPIAGCGRHLPASRVRLRGLQRRPRPGGRESRVTPELLQVAAFTVATALAATALAIPPAIAIAWVLARGRFPGRALLETVVSLPLVVPPVATGLLLLYVFGRRGPLGASLASAGLDVVFTWRGVVLAMAVMGLPLVVRTARTAFEQVDARYEQVAATLGARPLRVFFSISLPLAARGVVAGAVLGFARALGEFGATIMIAGNIPGRTRTLATAIYSYTETGRDSQAAAVAAVSIGLAFAAVAISNRLRRGTLTMLMLDVPSFRAPSP